MAFKRSGVRFPSPPLGRRELREFYVFMRRRGSCAGIAQLVEHNLAKVGVAGSSPVSRSGSTTGERRLPRFAFDPFGAPGWRNWQTRET